MTFAAFALVATTIACSGDSTTVSSANPTSFVVRADTLVAQRGCGTGAGQVYKYEAIVSQNTTPILWGLYDCFADASFAGLNGTNFDIVIYAFDVPSIAAMDKAAKDTAGSQNAIPTFAAGTAGGDATNLAKFATYSTKCTATQQANVTVLAICPDPLR